MVNTNLLSTIILETDEWFYNLLHESSCQQAPEATETWYRLKHTRKDLAIMVVTNTLQPLTNNYKFILIPSRKYWMLPEIVAVHRVMALHCLWMASYICLLEAEKLFPLKDCEVLSRRSRWAAIGGTRAVLHFLKAIRLCSGTPAT